MWPFLSPTRWDVPAAACNASCQRMYDFQSERLNFNFEELKPKESWDKRLRKLMEYFENDTQLRDILITGGDALMSQNKTLRNILKAVYKMAVRKRNANLHRAEGEKYAELQRVRLGSRLPVYLPMRINDELLEILREVQRKGICRRSQPISDSNAFPDSAGSNTRSA